MSYEPEQETQDGAEGAEGAEGIDNGADDLNSLHGGGEMAFVAETKQPMNKGTLIVVGLLIACGAATYFMYVRSGPDQAVAAGDPEADKTITKFLDNSQRNVAEMATMIRNTEKAVEQFKSQANDTQIPLAKLNGNPFSSGKQKPSANRAAEDAATKKAALIAKITEAAAELRLQTIIHRDPRKATCMINNTLYRKNQKITVGEGKITFTVVEIRPDGVTVVAPAGDEPQKFELKMKQGL
jgi:hypothetical protein